MSVMLAMGHSNDKLRCVLLNVICISVGLAVVVLQYLVTTWSELQAAGLHKFEDG